MTIEARRRIGFLVNTYPGQPPAAELARDAVAGCRPRRDYIELAASLGADVLDAEWMQARAHVSSRAVLRVAGMAAAQTWEGLLRRREYDTICAWSDRTGLPLALLCGITHSRPDLSMVSAWPSRPKKALVLQHLRAHRHLRAIVSGSDAQLRIATEQLGVPPHKVHHLPWPVDDRFWTPVPADPDGPVCTAGWEARDFGTLLRSMDGLPLEAEVAVGVAHLAAPPAPDPASAPSDGEREQDPVGVFRSLRRTYSYRRTVGVLDELKANPRMHVSHQLHPRQLRRLYARSRFVVVPLYDVDSDCGVTTVTEAMAMGRAVVVSSTRGLGDLITHGEHGLLVPPGDVRALRSAIGRLLDDPEQAERMGRAGRALVERRHALDAYVRRLASIIVDVPGSAGRA